MVTSSGEDEYLHVGNGGRRWVNCREWIYLLVKIRTYGQNYVQNPWLYYSIIWIIYRMFITIHSYSLAGKGDNVHFASAGVWVSAGRGGSVHFASAGPPSHFRMNPCFSMTPIFFVLFLLKVLLPTSQIGQKITWHFKKHILTNLPLRKMTWPLKDKNKK